MSTAPARTVLLAALVGLAVLTFLAVAGGVTYFVWADRQAKAEAVRRADEEAAARRRVEAIKGELERLSLFVQVEVLKTFDPDAPFAPAPPVESLPEVKKLTAAADVLKREHDAIADRYPLWGLKRYFPAGW